MVGIPDETVRLHAERHGFVKVRDFESREDLVQHLIHLTAYERALPLCAGKRVLDLGCNLGYGSNLLARSAASVVGVDVSPRAIAEARKSVSAPNARFEVIDGVTLPFEDGSFDVVASFQVIEHIARPESFLTQLRRVMSPNGVAIVTTPNGPLRLDPGMRPWNEFHVREYSASELREELAPWFSNVRVYGLFAADEVYRIELERVTRAREQSRAAMSGGAGAMIAAAKTWAKHAFPVSMVAAIARFRARRRGKASRAEMANFTARHGVRDFHYRSSGLEEALDLLAICSNGDLGSAARMVVPEADTSAG